MLQQGSVLMVYGLNMDKVNCIKLFNLFCLYGNVVRVSATLIISYLENIGRKSLPRIDWGTKTKKLTKKTG